MFEGKLPVSYLNACVQLCLRGTWFCMLFFVFIALLLSQMGPS